MSSRMAKDIVNEFDSAERLYHYTTIESLKKILISKSLLMNRNDRLNDIVESHRSKDADTDYFVSCFTHISDESIPHWFMYGGKDKGVRISIKNRNIFNNKYYFFEDREKKYFSYEQRGSEQGKPIYNNVYHVENGVMVLSGVHKARVNYNDSILLNSPTTTEYAEGLQMKLINIYDMASTKSEAWSFENESRFFITLFNNTHDVKSIFVELNEEVFQDIIITLNPFLSEENLQQIEWELRTLFPEVNMTFIISKLYGKIK